VADNHWGLRNSLRQGLLDDKSLEGLGGELELGLVGEGFKLSNAAVVLGVLVVVIERSEVKVLHAGLLPEASVVEVGLVEHRVVLVDGTIQFEEL
jgi:hypothetical protein